MIWYGLLQLNHWFIQWIPDQIVNISITRLGGNPAFASNF